MFKKLKEKITEEVKSSPQRFQQLTQSVSDRLQNASTSDENFFSIGDDDASTPNTTLEPGFTNVSLMSPQENKFRRNSNTSIASDVSFLPRYESMANMYHLQSDLEVSASEIEDNASSSSQLGHLSKEQIYSAFQKAQMRYHKYRGRYTDLAKHYKELERENGKMKSVLVDTQDKAIRRVTELKEQCALEQKAKAHLESALRDEIDEKQFKIQSLQTKIELLQNGVNSSQGSENLETLNQYLTDARQEIESLNEKIQEMKANIIIFQTKDQEYKAKISSLEKELSLFAEREKENNLSLAQNKMELHNELLSRDNEISVLKQDNETLRSKLEVVTGGNNKLENLQLQNKKLIEKLENLTQKCNIYENDLLKMEQYKSEVGNLTASNVHLKEQLKEIEDKLESVREDAKKSLISLEDKIKEKLQKEFEAKEQVMKEEFRRKVEEVTSSKDNVQEIQLTLIEKEEEMKKIKENNGQILQDLAARNQKYDALEQNHLELIEDSVELRSKISSLEKELAVLQNENEVSVLKIARLENDIKTLESELKNYGELEVAFITCQKEKEICDIKHNELLGKINVDEDKYESLLNENEKLKQEIDGLKKSNQKREEILEEKAKQLEVKLEEEKENLFLKLETSENTVKRLEEASSTLRSELEELNVKNEEINGLQLEIQNLYLERNQLKDTLENELKSKEEINSALDKLSTECEICKAENQKLLDQLADSSDNQKKLEESNKDLSNKVWHLEESVKNLSIKLEDKDNDTLSLQSKEDKIVQLEESNAKLNNEFSKLLEEQSVQTQNLKEKEEKIKMLEVKIDELNTELASLTDVLNNKNEEILSLRENLQTHLHDVEEKLLLEKLLQEASSNLTNKEHEFQEFEAKYVSSEDKVKNLLKQMEHFVQREQELMLKIEKCEDNLKLKDLEINALSSKLEDYNNLIQQRNEGFLKIFDNFSIETPNNFQNLDDLLTLDEKLQNFDKIYSIEKENITKILTYLKQFEENYSMMVFNRNQLENEKQQLLQEIKGLQSKVQEEITSLEEENARLLENHKKITQNVLELESRNIQVVSDSNFLSDENNRLLIEIEQLKVRNEEIETKCKNSELRISELQSTIDNLEKDSKEISSSKNQMIELERHISELQHEKQLMKEEIEELKTSPVNVHNKSNEEEENYIKEIENLRTKIVQYKSLDVSNRTSIDFYENELQKLKNQNEKLNRKLDETLVTLNHCSQLSQSTEIEYLKNVLYNYMLGKESLVLARVIAAVCKFDPHQTEMILAKEQQKQTLLGQLGIL